ncbi:hypothetical protein QT970_17345 [Microcoleus sp. herbarium8]|uniref:hypothetical protein n=1 Tax=Microcoleus sp. herbarium8 TaxID=3055436 RepID=UPI002FCE9C65
MIYFSLIFLAILSSSCISSNITPTSLPAGALQYKKGQVLRSKVKLVHKNYFDPQNLGYFSRDMGAIIVPSKVDNVDTRAVWLPKNTRFKIVNVKGEWSPSFGKLNFAEAEFYHDKKLFKGTILSSTSKVFYNIAGFDQLSTINPKIFEIEVQ